MPRKKTLSSKEKQRHDQQQEQDEAYVQAATAAENKEPRGKRRIKARSSTGESPNGRPTYGWREDQLTEDEKAGKFVHRAREMSKRDKKSGSKKAGRGKKAEKASPNLGFENSVPTHSEVSGYPFSRGRYVAYLTSTTQPKQQESTTPLSKINECLCMYNTR
jgi:hypothetical protein